MKNKPVPASVYRRHLSRAHNSSNYFTFFRLYYKIMKRGEALFVQDLMNLSDINGVEKKSIDGLEFFLCTEEFLRSSDSEWSIREQKTHIVKLEEKGFIRRVKRGVPGRRWIHIDYGKIEKALDKALGISEEPDQLGPNRPDQLGPNRPDQLGPNRPEKKESSSEEDSQRIEEQHPSFPRDSKIGFFKVEEDEVRFNTNPTPAQFCVRLLYQTVREKDPDQLVPHRRRKRSLMISWEKEFTRILKKWGEDKVIEVLKEHCLHMNEEYEPEAYSPSSFDAKFNSIQKQIIKRERDGQTRNKEETRGTGW